MLIKDFDEATHLEGVRACLIELQDFERSLDPRMPSGAEIVDDYIPVMMDRCQTSHGKIFVATLKELVIGFTTVLAEVRSDEIADGNVEYGLVYDLVVAGEFRGRGIGRQLLEAAETYARAKGVKWLRIGVLASNHSAAGLYDSMGFKPLYIEREKALL